MPSPKGRTQQRMRRALSRGRGRRAYNLHLCSDCGKKYKVFRSKRGKSDLVCASQGSRHTSDSGPCIGSGFS